MGRKKKDPPKAEPKPPSIQRVKYIADHLVPLSPNEIAGASIRLVAAHREAFRLEDESREAAKKAKELRKEVAALSVAMERGEMREVRCERVLDFEEGTITEVRLDTGAIVAGPRPMNPWERQPDFFSMDDDEAEDGGQPDPDEEDEA